MHVRREKSRKDASENIFGEKPNEISEGIVEAIEAEKTGPSRELELLPT